MGVVERTVELLRRDEYTGENRCRPCTVVNVGIGLHLSVLVGVWVGSIWSGTLAALGGAGVFALSSLLIYLRGYLIPGTPALTKRFLPERVLARFEKHPTADGLTGTDSDEPRDESLPSAESVLADARVVTPCENADDLCLDDAFRREWNDRMRTVREGGIEKRRLGEALGVDPAELTFDEYGDAFNARIDGSRVGQWESKAALVADLAASRALHSRYDRWATLPTAAQGEALYGLRAFLDACPVCDAPVAPERETVDSCCRTADVVAMSCDGCGARLFEAEASSGNSPG